MRRDGGAEGVRSWVGSGNGLSEGPVAAAICASGGRSYWNARLHCRYFLGTMTLHGRRRVEAASGT